MLSGRVFRPKAHSFVFVTKCTQMLFRQVSVLSVCRRRKKAGSWLRGLKTEFI